MNRCNNCTKQISSGKYCSRSCAAIVNNKIPKRIKQEVPNCAYCGNPVKTVTAKFCSAACFGHDLSESTTKRVVEAWLQTGEITGQVPRSVKIYVLEQQDHKCSICGMPDEWNNLPLVFVLDPIDGNSDNNRRDNLRCVCPNCDSQLPTFKAKNRGNGRHYRRQRYAEGKSS